MAQAQLVLDVLSRHGVTDVVSLPDNSSSALLALLRQSADIRLLSVTREGAQPSAPTRREIEKLCKGKQMRADKPAVPLDSLGVNGNGRARATLSR